MYPPSLGPNPDLKSGHPVLEFTNTVSNHAGPQPGETLRGYADLLGWAQRVGWLDPARVRDLTRLAARQRSKAAQVLSGAVRLREALYRICVALTKDKPPADADLSVLNGYVRQATAAAQLIHQPSSVAFQWDWSLDENALDFPLRLIALSAADLLTTEHISRLGQCADEDGCGWLFLDTTRNHSRRWCDINDCGNRAKQRRHQQRARGKS